MEKEINEIKESKVSAILVNLLFIVASIAPFFFTVINAGSYIFTNGYAKQFLLIFYLFTFFMVYCTYLYMKNLPDEFDKKSNIKIVIVLILFAFLLRLFAVQIIRTQPVSDFFMAYDNAKNLAEGVIAPVYQDRYSRFAQWGFYSVTLSWIFKMFSPTVFAGQVFNCILGALTTAAIYLSAKKICASYKIGLLAAILFMINPTVIIYTGVLSGEHIVILFSCFAIYSLCCFHEERRYGASIKKIILMCMLFGASIGLMESYRPLGAVCVIAFIIVEFLFYIVSYIKNWKQIGKTNTCRNISVSILLILIVSTVIITVPQVNKMILRKTMDLETFNEIGGYGYVFLMGVGIDENGNYTKQVARDFMAAYEGDPKDSSKACLEEGMKYVKKYYYKYPAILYDKFTTVWGRHRKYQETAYIEWVFKSTAILNQNESGNHPITENYYPEVSTFLGQYYFFLMLFGGVGVLSMLKGKINKVLLFQVLVIFGFMLILLIGEAQGRYRSVLFPYISIFSSLGVKFIIDTIHSIKEAIYGKF